MNVKNNQRARDTDEKIVRAVYQIMLKEKKPISRVTVREVCELAGINRSTFYAHYQDVFDVLESVERTMSQGLTESFLDQLEKGAGMGECFESLFAYIKKYENFYRVYLNETGRIGVIGIAWELLQDKLKTVSFREMGFASQEELEYHGEFFLFGMTAMVRRWVNGGCGETPRQMVEILERQYDVKRSLFNW